MKRVCIAVAGGLAASACAVPVEERAAQLCERAVRDDLGIADLRRTGFSASRSALLTPAQYERAAGYSDPVGDDETAELARTAQVVRRSELREAGGDLRLLKVRLDLAAGKSAKQAVCAFRLLRGRLDSDERLARALAPAAGDQARAVLAGIKGRPVPASVRGKYRCCLPDF